MEFNSVILCLRWKWSANLNITRRSRGIRAAWHFWHAVSFGGEGGLRRVGLGGPHPL
ncbi:DUF3265 domain-containing protein, partial [Vibrio vulnificus]|nr:DUF3265 domain-containing protein [Vibrio vulnificus]